MPTTLKSLSHVALTAAPKSAAPPWAAPIYPGMDTPANALTKFALDQLLSYLLGLALTPCFPDSTPDWEKDALVEGLLYTLKGSWYLGRRYLNARLQAARRPPELPPAPEPPEPFAALPPVS